MMPGHLMQHLYCACVVALLSATVKKALSMRHLEFLEMKAAVVVCRPFEGSY